MADRPEKGDPEGQVMPGHVQYVTPQPQRAEAVYIHSKTTIKMETYHSMLSLIFGIVLIVLQTVSLALNIGGAFSQRDRSGNNFFLNGNLFFLFFPAVWCGIFVYISAGFAIASGKVKSRGLIIAHLVLACIACVFSFISLAISLGAVCYDGERRVVTQGDKASLGISVVWLAVCLTIFIILVWCAVLCCKVLCCGRIKEATSLEMITPINSPSSTVDYQSTETGSAPPPYEK